MAADTVELRYAGFWRRVLASVIDSVIVGVPLFLAVLLVVPEYFDLTERGPKNYPVVPLTASAIWWLYRASMESSVGQATLGKRAIKLLVTDLEGNRLGFGRATARSWPYWIGLAASAILSPIFALAPTLLVIVACITVAFSKRKQGLHDMMAECVVVRRGADFDKPDSVVLR